MSRRGDPPVPGYGRGCPGPFDHEIGPISSANRGPRGRLAAVDAWSAIRRRLVVAAAVAGVGFCGHAPPVAASTGDELLPNLVTIGVQEDDLAVVRERGRTLLRFTTEVANRGAGPLEV